MKKIVLIVTALIIVLAGYILLQNPTPQNSTTNTISQQEQIQNQDVKQSKFISSDKRIQLTYPSDLYVTVTTPSSGTGEFGPYIQSWIITSFENLNAGQGGVPENNVKIDFEIMQGGGNLPLESLIDCEMKTESCERVGINNELFIKGVTTLNTGMKIIQIATFYDNNVFRATASVQSGSEQATNAVAIEKILNSISFINTTN